MPAVYCSVDAMLLSLCLPCRCIYFRMPCCAVLWTKWSSKNDLGLEGQQEAATGLLFLGRLTMAPPKSFRWPGLLLSDNGVDNLCSTDTLDKGTIRSWIERRVT